MSLDGKRISFQFTSELNLPNSHCLHKLHPASPSCFCLLSSTFSSAYKAELAPSTPFHWGLNPGSRGGGWEAKLPHCLAKTHCTAITCKFLACFPAYAMGKVKAAAKGLCEAGRSFNHANLANVKNLFKLICSSVNQRKAGLTSGLIYTSKQIHDYKAITCMSTRKPILMSPKGLTCR